MTKYLKPNGFKKKDLSELGWTAKKLWKNFSNESVSTKKLYRKKWESLLKMAVNFAARRLS